MDDEIIEAEQDEDMRKFLTSIKENQIRFANDTDVKEKMYNLYGKIKEENECSICTQVPIPYSEMVVTPCAHTFCLSCILEHLDFQKELKKEKLCPNCRLPISKYQLFRIRNQPTKETKSGFIPRKTLLIIVFNCILYDPNRSSSKYRLW